MPKKNEGIFQDVNSIALVALWWKQHTQSSMKSTGNSNINSHTYVSLILSHVRRKHVNADCLKSLFILLKN